MLIFFPTLNDRLLKLGRMPSLLVLQFLGLQTMLKAWFLLSVIHALNLKFHIGLESNICCQPCATKVFIDDPLAILQLSKESRPAKDL